MAVSKTYNLITTKSQFFANSYELEAQFGSEVIGLSNGGFAVVYGTDRNAPSINDFPLVTFYDADYNVVGTFTVPYSSSPIDMIGDPDITELSNGNVAVMWKEGAGASGDVQGAIVNPNTGGIVVPEFQINGFSDVDPEGTALVGGNWVVAMTSGSTIFMQMMDNAGNMVGGQFSTGVTGPDTDPVITALNDGGFVVTYTSVDGADTQVYGTIYNADRSVRTPDFLVSSGGGGVGNINESSAVAALNNGNWAVIYKDSGWDGDGLTLHIFDPNGVDLTGFIRVDDNVANIEEDPDITVLENGFIVVSWTDPNGLGNILAKAFEEDGTVVPVNGVTTPFTITATPTADTDSSISAIMNGIFATTWSDTNADSDGDSISGEVNEIISTITSDANGDFLQGSALRESMFGNGGSDNMLAGNGDDVMYGGGGNEFMNGGGGDDEMYGDGGLDTMRGGIGSDYMEGGVGIDDMNGGTGNDTMYGGGGNDLMNGAAGDDVMFGGDQNDRMGGQGGVDTLRGENGNDFITGGDENDTLFGGIGNDRLYGQADNDTMYGEAGIDYINGDIGNDFAVGGAGDDRLFGGAGNDTLLGGTDNDLLVGGTGNDYLDGDSGDDRLRGDDGSDTFNFFSGLGDDRVLDFENDIDTIVLDDAIWGGGLSVAQVLSTYGTQVAFNRYDLDFGGGDSIIITGRFGAGVTGIDLSDDMSII